MTAPRAQDGATAQQGTPGPWTLRHDGDFDERTRQEYRWPWQIVGADDAVIVDFTGGTDISDEDAELIRSAPELKAALLAFVHTYANVEQLSYDMTEVKLFEAWLKGCAALGVKLDGTPRRYPTTAAQP